MNTPNTGKSSSNQYSGQQSQGHDTPLTDATYNMVSALHNIVDGLWHYDQYIQQDQDSDAQEMWQRFKQQDMQKAIELRDHLSRRLQHETGPAGKVGHGPHESSQRQ
jgi:hypothetical protein